MRQKYTVINICAGIGVMSSAFEQAGFKVVCNLVKDKGEKYILSRNLDADIEYLSEVILEELPVTDIVIGGSVSLYDLSTVSMRGRKQSPELYLDMIRFLCKHGKPKAFLFDLNTPTKRSRIFQNLIALFSEEEYTYYYDKFALKNVTGAPVSQQKGYMIAIRSDITRDFLFPDHSENLRPFEEFQEKDVDHTYNVKNGKILSECSDDGLYVWKDGKYQISKEVNGVYRLPVVRSSERLRWITPRELARLKGIPDNYFPDGENRRWLYRAIWAEPHMDFTRLLAGELYRVIESVEEHYDIEYKTEIPPKNTLLKETGTVERRFDVFVSSTYEDLIEERKEVTQAILECDCMPVGMEMFPASNLEQWNFIKKVIDKSDIYLVIIAGKYGSESRDESGHRISYTEMEFNYALKQGKPILAFLVDNIGKLERNKTEEDNSKMELLKNFKEKIKASRLIKYYKNKDDLKAKVISSLNQIKKQIDSGGWVRADENSISSSREFTEKIRLLQAEKDTLQKQIDEFIQKEYEAKLRDKTMHAKLNEIVKNVESLGGQVKSFQSYMGTEKKG